MVTNLGDIVIELNTKAAPISSANFLKYVNSGFYDGLIFHRVIPNFMIQGGGFNSTMEQKETNPAIKNEANNGLKNQRGTIAMARTNVIDSATSQFFINLVNNDFLNYQSPKNYGYAVFGKVIDGMDIVDKIAEIKTGRSKGYDNVPLEPIKIIQAKVIQ
ncbi:peptidylprolyl isomerase [Utexia brackfieldae]